MACTNYPISEIEQDYHLPVILDNYYSANLNQEQAIKQALEIRSFFPLTNITRAGQSIEILDIKPLVDTRAITRSSENTTDTLVYVINFADDNGYIVLCANQSQM